MKYLPNWLGTSRNLFKTKQVTTQSGNDVFNKYVSGNRNYWDRYLYGSNRELRGIYNRLRLNENGLNSTEKPYENKSENKEKPSENKSTENVEKSNREHQFNKATINRYKNILNDKFSKNKLKSGEIEINGQKVQVVEQTDGTFNIMVKGEHKGNYRNQIELQKHIREIVKQSRKASSSRPKLSTKEVGKLLQDLKKKGWLKHGGSFNYFSKYDY